MGVGRDGGEEEIRSHSEEGRAEMEAVGKL